jgi:hypothetical protein
MNTGNEWRAEYLKASGHDAMSHTVPKLPTDMQLRLVHPLTGIWSRYLENKKQGHLTAWGQGSVTRIFDYTW